MLASEWIFLSTFLMFGVMTDFFLYVGNWKTRQTFQKIIYSQ